MYKVTATAPTRIDIVGGTLDLWPIHNLLVNKATVNIAISLNATVTVESSKDHLYHLKSIDQTTQDSGDFLQICNSSSLRLLGLLVSAVWDKSLPPITVATTAQSPAGAGLGGSSCLAISTLKALLVARAHFRGEKDATSEDYMVRIAQDVESLMIHAPTGVQDYWGAVRGGLNILRYPFGSVTVETLTPSNWQTQDFRIICCYSGKSRASAINNWEIFKRIFDGDAVLIQQMNEIGNESEICASAILKNNWSDAIATSAKEWSLRCKLWPGIQTPETSAIDQAARQAGAILSRVCGAGGGGVMATFAPTDRVQAVTLAMKAAGGTILDAQLGAPGVRILD